MAATQVNGDLGQVSEAEAGGSLATAPESLLSPRAERPPLEGLQC